jgi:hypothetical protein
VRRLIQILVFTCVVIAIGGGCSSTQMKGTPFYTGEYSVRRGPVEDRVNLWPLLYYREPALSILWPLGEATEDHLAIRPLMSIYDRDTEDPVYNVLWPLARFDTRNDRHRIVPFFWGDDYVVGFPFYWHFDDPWGDGGYDGLLPLWSYRSRGKGRYSTHVLWPFVHAKQWNEHEAGWRVWPLAGSYRKHAKRYSFAAWPLGHQWSDSRQDSGGSCLFPLYYQHADRGADESIFLSLPYSRRETPEASWETLLPLYHRRKTATTKSFYSLLYSSGSDRERDEKWNLAVPLWYSRESETERVFHTLAGGYSRDSQASRWWALPILGGGSSTDTGGDLWIGGPLAHVGWEGNYGQHHVFPLYYRSRGEEGNRFYSLPWSAGHEGNTKFWLSLPLLSGGRSTDDSGDFWAVGPLAHVGWDGAYGSHHIFPFYYRSRRDEGKRFYSLLWSSGKDADNSNWQLLLPLMYHHKDDRSETWLTPLYAQGTTDNGDRKWKSIVPLVYNRRTEDEHLVATLLGGYKETEDALSWLAYPLLAGGKVSEDSGSFWAVAPLIHARWDAEHSTHHALPLYYWNGWEDTFVSLAVSRWKDEGSTTTLVPPALSWLTAREKRSDLWMLGPLAHMSWGEEATSSHVFPLYYRNRESGTFASPLVANWERGGTDYRLVPPLLSLYAKDGGTKDLYALLGLFRQHWGEDVTNSGHLFPLYAYRENDYFLSPLVARWKGSASTTTLVPPALSWLTTREKCNDLWLLGPLAHMSWGEKATSSHVFPLYYHNRKSGAFSSALFASWESAGTELRMVPPLLSLYTKDGETKDLYALLGLFRQHWGKGVTKAGHLLPLYAYRDNDYFFSPLVGWNHDRDGFLYPLTPLVGIRRGDYSGGWLFPLWSRRKHRESGRVTGTFLWGNYWRRGDRAGSSIFPVYGYENFGPRPESSSEDHKPYGRYGKQFWAAPSCWYSNKTNIRENRGASKAVVPILEHHKKKHGFFPLWHYSRSEYANLKREDVSGSVLLLLYDYKRRVRTDLKEESSDDYVRSRVLWRLWHYERENGNVSVDVFPAITYDKKPDGFKKISFLWRLYRYEKGPKGKKLDLLFVPLIRQNPEGAL